MPEEWTKKQKVIGGIGIAGMAIGLVFLPSLLANGLYKMVDEMKNK